MKRKQIKSLMRECMGKKMIVSLFLVLTMTGMVFSLEPPTKDQLAQYRLDGSLERRIMDARAFGNDRMNPELVRNFQTKMERLRLESLGLPGMDDITVPASFPPGDDIPALMASGNNKVFALLIDFPDYPSTVTAASINAMVFGDGLGNSPYQSLRNFYRRSSYGQLELSGATLGWYRPAYNRTSVVETDGGRENLIKEALNYFDAQGHDFSQYDNDGDGNIDYFLVLWTGPTGAWASFWWGYFTGWRSGGNFILDGKHFTGTGYSWQWVSLYPSVIIHETGHALGLPDLYDYDQSVGPRGGVGGLDMMASNWGDHNGFSKMLLDWLIPSVCTYQQTLHLRPTELFPDAIIFWPNFRLDSPFREFFMVQNRFRIGNDTYIPADGLVIWHIDASLSASYGGCFLYNNSFSEHKFVRLMEADGLEEIENLLDSADAGDFYTAGGVFNSITSPNSNAYDGTTTNASIDQISVSGRDINCRAMANIRKVYPPANLSAIRLKNQSVSQFEYIVDLSWSPNPENDGLMLASYLVYRMVDDKWSLMASLSGSTFTWRHRAVPEAEQTYGIIAVTDIGTESDFAVVIK